ncbi:MAG: hypothetical protein LBS36_10125 [Oscillospiraceae bacterium]|jgi:hypothetical protein|nr:hypothetical protein [Oscillospiraceae bacterium]
MAVFLKHPNLPSKKVSACIVSPQISDEIKQNFLSLNIGVYFVTPCERIQAPVASHADMLAHHAGETLIFLEQSQNDLFGALQATGFQPKYIEESLHKNYPHDIALNICVVGKNILCNKNHAGREVLNHYKQAGFQILHVNQGYAKCSCLLLNENALITDDESIAFACRNAGIDALLIKKGDVRLKGYPYGFIGGAGGLIAPGRLCLFGNEQFHIDCARIRAFANKHNTQLINLSEYPLTDYGGMVPILQSE